MHARESIDPVLSAHEDDDALNHLKPVMLLDAIGGIKVSY